MFSIIALIIAYFTLPEEVIYFILAGNVIDNLTKGFLTTMIEDGIIFWITSSLIFGLIQPNIDSIWQFIGTGLIAIFISNFAYAGYSILKTRLLLFIYSSRN